MAIKTGISKLSKTPVLASLHEHFAVSDEPPSSPASPNRKKSLSWQRSNPMDSAVMQRRSEQSEDEVTAETSLLPRQNEPPAEDKVKYHPPDIKLNVQ